MHQIVIKDLTNHRDVIKMYFAPEMTGGRVSGYGGRPMFNFFNRTKLFSDTSAEAVVKAKAALENSGIPCIVKASGSASGAGSDGAMVRVPRSGRTGTIGSGYSGGTYMGGGIPGSWSNRGAAGSVYTLYVLRKDRKKAKEICGIK